MNRPRIPLGLESSRATLNHDVCTQLGRELAAARESRGLSVHDAAARLLLSPCQVSGLEHADAEAFYSAELYLVAARKYAALVGAASPLLEDVLVRPPAETDEVAPAAHPLALVSTNARPVGLLAAAAVVALSAMVGWYVVSRGWPVAEIAQTPVHPAAAPTLAHLVSTSLPAPTAEVRLTAPDRHRVTAAAAGAGLSNAPADHRYGYVRVERDTWVFVRYRDNSTVERVLAPGQRFVLQGQPIYIAAGAASGAEVVLGGEAIDVGRFDVDGQLRIGSAFLSAALR